MISAVTAKVHIEKERKNQDVKEQTFENGNGTTY